MAELVDGESTTAALNRIRRTFERRGHDLTKLPRFDGAGEFRGRPPIMVPVWLAKEILDGLGARYEDKELRDKRDSAPPRAGQTVGIRYLADNRMPRMMDDVAGNRNYHALARAAEELVDGFRRGMKAIPIEDAERVMRRAAELRGDREWYDLQVKLESPLRRFALKEAERTKDPKLREKLQTYASGKRSWEAGITHREIQALRRARKAAKR